MLSPGGGGSPTGRPELRTDPARPIAAALALWALAVAAGVAGNAPERELEPREERWVNKR